MLPFISYQPFSGCGDRGFIFHSSSISFSQRSHPLLSVCVFSLSSLRTQHIDYVCTAQQHDGWSFIVHNTFQELHSRAALQRSPKQQSWLGTGYKTSKNKQQKKTHVMASYSSSGAVQVSKAQISQIDLHWLQVLDVPRFSPVTHHEL